jgi:ABC-type uncharacterized transport system permease subunit
VRPRGAGVALAAIALGLIALALGLQLAGFDARTALTALWGGAFGSWYAFTSASLVRAIPLIIIGLGIALAFRAGSFNIGAEGQFYAGAITATWIGLHAGALPSAIAVPVLLLGAALSGAVWVALPVWLQLRFGVIEVISTLVLNFVAESLVSLMVQGPLQESQGIYPQSDMIAASSALAYVFRRTLWGFQLQAVGAGPRAAEISGRIDARRLAAMALLGSGAIAGLAGGVEVAGVSYALFQNLSAGYGFTGIAVALLARLDPLAVIATGILFGGLEAGAAAMQRDAGVPSVAVYIVEAIVVLIVVLADSAKRRP